MSAYLVNDRLVPDADFYRVACDPQVPVVVEACAGAGKTWMLVSRIVRALLEGAEPSQILAITFTRKAAGEMRERLQGLLRELALASHDQRVQGLCLRGLSLERAQALAPKLPAIYEKALSSGQSVQVSTIHGWFSRLLRAAPMDTLSQLGLPPQLKLLHEDEVDPWPTLWGRLLKRIDADEGDLRSAFVRLMQSERRSNLEAWLQAALGNRLEISLADAHDRLWTSVPSAQDSLPAWRSYSDPLVALGQAPLVEEARALAAEMGQLEGVKAQEAARLVVDALLTSDLQQRHALLNQAVMKKDGEPRKDISKKLQLLMPFQEWLQGLNQALAQNEAMRLHQDMVTLTRVLFEVYEAFKRDGGYIDMVDLERGADHLLRDDALAAWVQQRLDQQLRHVLIDEFQDTSPLQWRALREWLASYAGAGGGTDIKVFIVGDPKQSIYRFRRAEPRVFLAAKDFVKETLGGALLACDHTRRNAPGIIDGLNRVMAPLAQSGRFTGFRPHTTSSTDRHEWRCLPDVLRPPRAERHSSASKEKRNLEWRDSLNQARHLPDEVLREEEAEHCASAIAELMVTQGKQPQDFFILARKRQSLLLAAQALAQRGIAHAAPQDTLLADTPEARDLLAVLQAIVSPVHELALAHALRTPGLDVGDEGLMRLARSAKHAPPQEGGRWWGALQDVLKAEESLFDDETTARLKRAGRLLGTWRQVSHLLPPHDLMQRIVDDCDWRLALAERLSPSMCRQALLHLDAMLGQSLMLRGGRDATPYRWVRELRRLKTPLPAAASRDAVQLLTIHGAKGLEADVVFLMDTDGEPARADHHLVLVDWQPDQEAPTRCAFLAKESSPPPAMVDWMQAELQARHTEECNALYVALTRARQALYFSRTEPSRQHPHGSWWHALTSSGALNDSMRWAPSGRNGLLDTADAKLTERFNSLARLPKLAPKLTAKAAAQMAADPASEELARLGKAVHRVLEMITTRSMQERGPAIRDALARQAWRTVTQEEARPEPLTEERLQRLLWQVGRVLDHPHAQPWLDPDQLEWAANELVLWQDGRPIRIDRLVRRKTSQGVEWWVLDYKLSESPEQLPAYQQQMASYLRAVEPLAEGAPVRGAFITGTGEFHAL
jgi:ATP-dependent helicase/nuclease subunit A